MYRTREEIIESSGAIFKSITMGNMTRMQSKDDAILEVLLDIRDLLAKDNTNNIRSDYIEDRDNRYTKQ